MTDEIRSISSTGARKGVKPCRPDLIPAKAHMELATHYGAGAAKYTEYDDEGNVTHEGGNNWRLGYEWSKSIAALERHVLAFKGGEDFDDEFGSKHIIAAAWHCLTLATFMDDHRGFDDRWSTLNAIPNATVDDLTYANPAYVWVSDMGLRFRFDRGLWEASAVENALTLGWTTVPALFGSPYPEEQYAPFTRAEPVEMTRP